MDLAEILLPHLSETSIYRRRRGLDEFSVFSDRATLDVLVSSLAEILKVEFPNVSTLAALGPSGMPLAACLTLAPETQVDRWVYVADPAVSPVSRKYAPVLPESVPKGDNRDSDYLRDLPIVMIDSVIKTGLTAVESCHKLRKKEADLRGVIAILNYPGFADEEHFLDDLDISIFSLFSCYPNKSSPLVPAWKTK